jgi:signal transduction histidine kinase
MIAPVFIRINGLAQSLKQWEAKGDSLMAKYQFETARQAFQKANQKDPELWYKLNLTYSADIKKENIEALKFLYRILSTKNISPLLLAKAYTQLGYRYHRNYELDSAKKYLEKGIKMGLPLKYIVPIQKITRFYFNTGNYAEASKYGYQALKEAEKNRDSLVLFSIFFDLGDINMVLGNTQKALGYWQKIINVEKNKQFSEVLGRTYESFASYYSDQAFEKSDSTLTQKALIYYEKGLAADKKVNNIQGVAYQLVNLADQYKNLQQFERAESYFKQAEGIFIKLGKSQEMGAFYLNYGDFLYTSNKDKKRGIELVEMSNQIWEKAGRKYNQTVTLAALALGSEQMGNYKKALKYTQQQYKIEKDIANEESKMQLQDLSLKYETEKKDARLTEQRLEIVEKQHQITRIVLLASIFILTLLIFFTIYRIYQNRKLKKLESTFEQTTQQLRSFNYSVSHDLRHPLISTQYALDTLKNTTLSSEQLTQIQKAEDSLKNMNEVIEAMLTLSAIERDTLNIKVIDLRELIMDVLEGFNTQAHIQLTDLPTVRADIRQLRQVMVNLLSNAIKYTAHQPEPKIQITGHEDSVKIWIEVEDNGLGFDEHLSAKLFQLFGRLHPNVNGIGVGLVIVKRIIEKHGGKVWAKGKLGQGAVFGFTLPK